MPRIGQLVQSKGLKDTSIKRSPSASPATGSAKAHELEQKNSIESGIHYQSYRLRLSKSFNIPFIFASSGSHARPAHFVHHCDTRRLK